MSTSRTRCERSASPRAKLAQSVVFPTPPLAWNTQIMVVSEAGGSGARFIAKDWHGVDEMGSGGTEQTVPKMKRMSHDRLLAALKLHVLSPWVGWVCGVTQYH